jgi:hypothetical protein
VSTIRAGSGISQRRTGPWRGAILVVLAIAFIGGSLWLGLKVRSWTWNFSVQQRLYFWPDILNAWYWGSYTVNDAHSRWGAAIHERGAPGVTWPVFWHRLRTVYRRDEMDAGPRDNYVLDYVPGKMAIVALWNWHERAIDPTARHWRPWRMQPMLWVNTIIELFGCVAIFLLVRHWINRRREPPLARRCWTGRLWPWRGDRAERSLVVSDARSSAHHQPLTRAWILGLIAAAIFWFNPAAIQSAHNWVQYDIWIVPFYIMAVYLASRDWLFAAGVVIGVGGWLKGQQFFVAAIFVFWPIFEWRVLKAVEFLAGLTLTFGLLVSPWMLQTRIDWIFLGGVLAATILAGAWIFYKTKLPTFYGVLFMLPALVLVLWPWLSGRTTTRWWANALLAAWLCAGPWLVARRRAWFYAAVSLAAGLAVTALTLPAEFGWLRVSYGYGTHHYMILSFPDTCGLGNILERSFGWRLLDPVFTLHVPWTAWHWTVNMRYFLFGLYVITLVMAALGAALQRQRNDPRFVIAMITPWLTFFALGPQMHERYLLWGATMLASAGMVVDVGGVGLTLLGILLSLITVMMVLAVELTENHRYMYWFWRIRHLEPGPAYAVLLACAICMYLSLAPRKKRPVL